MRTLLASLHVALLACLLASAARYQWEDGYNADLRGDAPESLPTPAPLLYNKRPDLSTPPINKTTGSGIFNHLFNREAIIGCERCAGATACCNNGTYCCTTAGTACTTATWCCPTGESACSVANTCAASGETCCGAGVCPSGSSCCGRTCCAFTCQDGAICVDTGSISALSVLSLQSLLSLESVASVQSVDQNHPVSPGSQSSTSTTSSSPPPPQTSPSDPPPVSPSTTSTSSPPPVSPSNPPPDDSDPTPPPSTTSTSSTPQSSPSDPPPVSPPSDDSDPTPPPDSSTSTSTDPPDTPTSTAPPDTPPPDTSPSTSPLDTSNPIDPTDTTDDTPPPDTSSDPPPTPTSSPDIALVTPSDPPPTSPSNSPQFSPDVTDAEIDETQVTTSTTAAAPPPATATTAAANTQTQTVAPLDQTISSDPGTTAPVVTPTPTTIVSNGATLTVTPTVQTPAATNTGTNAAGNTLTTVNAQEDSSDAVALVEPWDPRIVYSPPNAWVSTSSSSGTGNSSSSSVGSCHNGTMVCNDIGAYITFPFQGKEIAVLMVDGSKAGTYSVQIDSTPASTLSGYKAPGTQGDQCLVSQPFTSGEFPEGSHTITVTIKGSAAGGTGGTQVEFGGFIYRGEHAVGTDGGAKSNIPAIVGGTVGGVVGGIAILAIVIVIIIRRRRRNQRLDNASAIDQTATVAPTHASATPYTPVPMAEYHDPYASAGLGPQYYPTPAAAPYQIQEQAQQPAWSSTNQGPFGSGSFAAAGPSHQYGYAQ